ncbi:MAG: hypothetical protein AAF573_09345 [Bacteroidota bacterium]
MKKLLFIALILASYLNASFAHGGDPTRTSDSKKAMVSTLTGEWVYTNISYEVADNVHYCSDLVVAEETFVRFYFDTSGTYTKTYGQGATEMIETGTWDVTDDVSLVLHPSDDTPVQFIKINRKDDERIEMELDIEAASLTDLFCTKINVLKFSKNMIPLSDSIIR